MSYISSMPILASSERPNRSCEMHLRTDHTWAKCVLKRIGKPQTRRHFRHLADDKGNHVETMWFTKGGVLNVWTQPRFDSTPAKKKTRLALQPHEMVQFVLLMR